MHSLTPAPPLPTSPNHLQTDIPFPKTAKSAPVPVYTIDNHPLTSGLLTHDVITQLQVREHSEIIKLGIINMKYPILLGLDWLKKHTKSTLDSVEPAKAFEQSDNESVSDGDDEGPEVRLGVFLPWLLTSFCCTFLRKPSSKTP